MLSPEYRIHGWKSIPSRRSKSDRGSTRGLNPALEVEGQVRSLQQTVGARRGRACHAKSRMRERYFTGRASRTRAAVLAQWLPVNASRALKFATLTTRAPRSIISRRDAAIDYQD